VASRALSRIALLILVAMLSTLVLNVSVLSSYTNIQAAAQSGKIVNADIVLNALTKTDDAYSPNPIEIEVGDTVIWTNKDRTLHTISAGTADEPTHIFGDTETGDPKYIAPKQTYQYTFDEEGEFPYYCTLHPAMVGTVIVGQDTSSGSNRLWYVGEGARQDMYVKYRIETIDTNNGDPFEMTVTFKEKNDGIWTAPTVIKAGSEIYTGTLRLGNELAVLSDSDIPNEMLQFINGYRDSIQWLASFTSQANPKSLNADSWDTLASIGGAPIKPLRTEEVTVPAGVYDTTVIGWTQGIENRIWVADNFPYPVKAETYADTSSNSPLIWYAFELLERGFDTDYGEEGDPIGDQNLPTTDYDAIPSLSISAVSLTKAKAMAMTVRNNSTGEAWFYEIQITINEGAVAKGVKTPAGWDSILIDDRTVVFTTDTSPLGTDGKLPFRIYSPEPITDFSWIGFNEDLDVLAEGTIEARIR
jgi:plastocyanin